MENKKSTENLTVKDIYELIWSKPINQLIQELGCSYNELKKICEEYNIPTPKNGHWIKLKFGKSSPQISLPQGDHERKVFGENASALPNENSASYKYHSIKKELLKDKNLSLVVPDRLANPDPIIKHQRKLLRVN
ncbi:hypothetical protein C7S20_16760 [Christiangramia fulva]|uniref:Uncharacterized protein n=2 Tax=Christiangramia fulva TaxID=2126553 RepID=A0A2R3Z941_9FLAO|nr:hypothetical protein C7S20_16760 [Christiangramia fulva]